MLEYAGSLVFFSFYKFHAIRFGHSTVYVTINIISNNESNLAGIEYIPCVAAYSGLLRYLEAILVPQCVFYGKRFRPVAMISIETTKLTNKQINTRKVA